MTPREIVLPSPIYLVPACPRERHPAVYHGRSRLPRPAASWHDAACSGPHDGLLGRNARERAVILMINCRIYLCNCENRYIKSREGLAFRL